MRTWPVTAFALALTSACSGDPTLSVSIAHPAKYQVTQTIVTAYNGQALSCDQIMLGDRTAAELAAFTTDELDASNGGTLQLSRLGDKAIVARGYTATQELATAGCQDVGELAGDTRVAIATVPAAVVAIEPDLADRPFADRRIAITMTDILGAPLEGTISWQMYGPAGVAVPQPSAGLPTTNGAVLLPIADLGTPGPEGMRVRAPWTTTTLPLLTAFDLSKSTTLDLGGGNLGGNPSCAIRGHGAGKPLTAVCLDGTTLGQHRGVAELAWSGSAWTRTTHPVPPAVQNTFALFVDRDGSADEPVYLVGADAAGNGTWYRLDGTATSPQMSGAIQKIVYVPKCSAAQATALVAVASGLANAISTVRVFTPDGGLDILVPNLANLTSGGCVSDVDGTLHQGVVATQVSGTTLGDPALFVLSGANMQSQAIAIKKNAGTGFIATEGGEQRFVGTRLEAEGTVVFEAVLAKVGASFGLVERAELAAAAPPTSIISGKIDADGGFDLVWDIGVPLSQRKLFQMSLSKQVLGVPLTAITSGPTMAGISDAVGFVVGDLNMRGVDEVLLFTANTATIYSPDQ